MRALLTGGYGVVGRWLVASLLERDAEVVLLARRPGRPSALVSDGLEARCRVVRGGLGDVAALEAALAGCDTAFHLAAQGVVEAAGRDPLATFETNVRGTWNVLEACRRAGVARVVVASSGRVYGAGGAPHREEDPLRAVGPYDVSKACADLLARSWASSHGLPVAVARTANVYGPGDLQRSRLVPSLVASVLEGRAARVRSDGSPERDLVFATDAAAAYLALADALPGGAAGEAFNVASGTSRPIREVVALLLEVAGSRVPPVYAASGAGDADRQALDITKLCARTGWAPRVELRDGLERTLAWHRRR